MIQLTINKTKVQPVYDYRLYKNIVGADKETQDSNFNDFLTGLCNDNPDTIVDFGVAVSGRKLADVDVAEQFVEQNLFDEPEKACDEIIEGFNTNGFLASKVKAFLKSENKSIVRLNTVLDDESLNESDKQELQLTIQSQEMTNKEHAKKLSKKISK